MRHFYLARLAITKASKAPTGMNIVGAELTDALVPFAIVVVPTVVVPVVVVPFTVTLVVVVVVELSSPTALITAPMSIMNNNSIRLGAIDLALLTCPADAVEFPVVTVVVRTVLVFAIVCVVLLALELLTAVTPRVAVARTTQNKPTFAHIASTQ